jgi:hypothetical protein
MPTSFIKSSIVTLLIAFQITSSDAVWSYIQSTGLPIGLFALSGLAVLLVGIMLYHISVKQLSKKNKPQYYQQADKTT